MTFQPTAQLRARFAAALSQMYGREVPAYTTLVEVASEINAELGGNNRVTAERHGAIRVGTSRELRQVGQIFGGFGMYPVGFTTSATPAASRSRWCPPHSVPSTPTSWRSTPSGCSPPC